MPKRSSKRADQRLGHGRAAAHDLAHADEVGRRRRAASTPCQIVGTPAAIVTLLGGDQVGDRAAASCADRGRPERAPAMRAAYGMPQALAWNIGTTGITVSRSRMPIASAWHGAIECRHGRAVRVDDALRAPGGAARVAHGRGRVLVEVGELEPGSPSAMQLLVVEGALALAARRPASGPRARRPRSAASRRAASASRKITLSSAWPTM